MMLTKPAVPKLSGVFSVFVAVRNKIAFPRDIELIQLLTLQCDGSMETNLQ